MTVGRILGVAMFGLCVVGAGARTPTSSELEQQYVGQQWLLNYPAIPCSKQTAEVTAIEVFKQKAQTRKPAKGETFEMEPPGREVRFTVRCPDGSSYTGKVALQYLQTVLAKPPAQ